VKSVRITIVAMLLSALAGIHPASAGPEERILLGGWTQSGLDRLIREAAAITDTGRRIEFLSGRFIGTAYKPSTLIGDENTPEVFVIDLEGMDCFTYLDYIEAMRLSSSFAAFKENLRVVRYRSGKVAFESRNHFFTDWAEFGSSRIVDVTGAVGGERTRSVRKVLNLREDGTLFLPGIAPRERVIRYIPANAVDEAVTARLRTGDYAGIYTEIKGLDVTHTGIIIKRQGRLYLRHASSSKENRKVVEEDLITYISKTPGLVVLRARQ